MSILQLYNDIKKHKRRQMVGSGPMSEGDP